MTDFDLGRRRTKPVQRPRLLRGSGDFIDEKMAAFFVDKVIRAVAEDVAADRGIAESVRLHGGSFGNVKGQRRFLERLQRNAGCATMLLTGTPEKQRFILIHDVLKVADDKLMIVRRTLRYKRHCKSNIAAWSPFVISRHALIRAVQRVQISSVEDIFRLLRIIWNSVERLHLTLQMNPITTAGKTCWLVPAPFGDDRMLGLLIARPADSPLALVTVYLDYMIPDALDPAIQAFLDTLDSETIEEEERSAALLALLPRLVV
jgi:hypothetical protein